MRQPLFRTRITELFGIRHPILCGGLMWLADARYVAAVVNAGGMGFITAVTFPDPERFRQELQDCRRLTGGKPFGVNISVSRRPGVLERFKPHLNILIEEGIRFVETSGASPDPILGPLKEAGVLVMHKVPALRYARSANASGVDAVAVVGAECGGHPGVYMMGSLVQSALAPKIVSKPLVVGGGYGTGRQLLAALAMGADAILLGSRMLASREIWAHQRYKERVVASDGSDTRVVMQIFNGHHRVLDNEAARQVAALEAQGVADFERYASLVAGEMARKAYETGDYSQGMIDWGQAVALVERMQTVEEIFDELIDDAVTARSRIDALAINRVPNPRRTQDVAV